MRIHVVFDRADADRAARSAEPTDVIFGDVGVADLSVECVTPVEDRAHTRRLVTATETLFADLKRVYGNAIEGFINVFFEASVLPIAIYADALARLIEERHAAGMQVTVRFPRRLFLPQYGATFFLAEHESHGRFLYRRHLVLQPYLEDLCRRLQVTVEYQSSPRLSLLGLQLFLRRHLTAGARYAVAVGKSLISSSRPAPVKAHDYVAIARNPSKSECLAPLLREASPRGVLLAGETVLSVRTNADFCLRLLEGSGVAHSPVALPGVAEVTRTYLSVLTLRWRGRRNWTVETGVVCIHAGPAIKEMLSSYADLLLYISALSKTIATQPPPRLKLLISTELKSPYAYGDAAVARRHGWSCVHLMECDQYARPLPKPVFGDRFIVDTPENLAAFVSVWPDQTERLRYWGAFKAWNGDRATRKVGEAMKWCFFTSADPGADLRVLKSARQACHAAGADLMIKLHPRDSRRHYSAFTDVEIVEDGELSKAEVFRNFDYGLTFHSAIIADLFTHRRPFLLLNLPGQHYFNPRVHEDRYPELTVSDLTELPAAMRGINDAAVAFAVYRRRWVDEDTKAGDVRTFAALMVDDICQSRLLPNPR